MCIVCPTISTKMIKDNVFIVHVSNPFGKFANITLYTVIKVGNSLCNSLHYPGESPPTKGDNNINTMAISTFHPFSLLNNKVITSWAPNYVPIAPPCNPGVAILFKIRTEEMSS